MLTVAITLVRTAYRASALRACFTCVTEQRRIVARWEDIANLLTGARDGSVSIAPGPVRVEAQSLFHTLADFPNCRTLLVERPTVPAPTPYGVPAGTVVAWSPSADRGEVEIDLANRVERIIAPAGWALCDGTNGTPNMVDRFARGTVTFRQIGQLSGSSAHVHPFPVIPRWQKVLTRLQGEVMTWSAWIIDTASTGPLIPPSTYRLVATLSTS